MLITTCVVRPFGLAILPGVEEAEVGTDSTGHRRNASDGEASPK